jgi:hypothetical protein
LLHYLVASIVPSTHIFLRLYSFNTMNNHKDYNELISNLISRHFIGDDKAKLEWLLEAYDYEDPIRDSFKQEFKAFIRAMRIFEVRNYIDSDEDDREFFDKYIVYDNDDSTYKKIEGCKYYRKVRTVEEAIDLVRGAIGDESGWSYGYWKEGPEDGAWDENEYRSCFNHEDLEYVNVDGCYKMFLSGLLYYMKNESIWDNDQPLLSTYAKYCGKTEDTNSTEDESK